MRRHHFGAQRPLNRTREPIIAPLHPAAMATTASVVQLRNSVRCWMIWTVVICVLASWVSVTAACPSVCECKWKGGKQTVECRNRGLITLPSNVDPETQVLDLSGSNLQILPREAFMRANLLNLQKIYLANCRIGQVDPTALRGLTNLVELDLSDNMLTAVPSEAFRDATSLRELRLNTNPIQKIDDAAFELLPGLVKLDLTDCHIQYLSPLAFQGLEQLSHLRLGGNKLTELKPRLVSSLTRLHSVELHNNPWICDCRLQQMRNWQQQYNIPSPVAATCAQPPRLAGKTLLELPLDEFACPPEAVVSSGYPRLVEAVAGQNVTLSCRMAAVPEPEITWLWRGRPLVNSSSAAGEMLVGPAAPDALTAASGNVVVLGGHGGRAIVVLEEGTVDKTSHLILMPARESDSGDFVCVAANPAGLAKINLTLKVDVQPPMAGGLGGAQIAGLGAGLLVLLALSVSIFLVVLIRCRNVDDAKSSSNSTAKDPHQLQLQLQQSANGFGVADHHQQIKSPSSSSMLEYGGQVAVTAFQNPQFPTVVKAVQSSNKPDLIHEARRAADYWHRSESDAGTGAAGVSSNRDSDCIDMVGHMVATGQYLSAQTDSLYPSTLWGHILPNGDNSEDASADGSPANGVLNLPHVPMRTVEPVMTSPSHSHYREPFLQQQTPQQVQQPESEAESVSTDSYSLPCRIPQHDPSAAGMYGSVGSVGSCGFVPYPPDFGLPRTSSPLSCLPSATSTLGRSQVTVTTDPSGRSSHVKINANASGWVTGSTPASTESSPASTAKSPRFWHRPQASNGKRSFARDSPDEGYQEECATDV